MGADRIEGRDVQGIGYVIERIPGRQVFGGRIGVAAFHAPIAVLDANAARAAALLLLSAAGVDIVGAARKVKEARAKVEAMNAARLCVPEEEDDVDTIEFRAACDERDRAVLAWDNLAAELAKLEGGA